MDVKVPVGPKGPVSPVTPSSASSQSSAKPPFPFGYVILTFPDEKAARAASSGPLEHLRSCYPGISILASCDPYNCRVGSGGGTLNALEEVLDAVDKSKWKNHFYYHDEAKESQKSILILHAGGASSRCPSQMVLGKAWTSLPCGGDPQRELQNPLLLWFRLAHDMFQNIIKGSVVVIASDTILDIPALSSPNGSQIDEFFWKSVPSASVVALAVPASLRVAKNHGVFVPNSHDGEELVTKRMISPCYQVYQKPSLRVLEEDCAFCLGSADDDITVEDDKAWIDTGVICFLPPAAQALKNLVQTSSSCELLRCTKRGLEMLWKKEHKSSSLAEHKDADRIMQEFSPMKARSIDLYTHFLNALHISKAHTTTAASYCASYQGQLDKDVALLIYRALSPLKLLVWTEPSGCFLHLGTTRELVQFLVAGTEQREEDKDRNETQNRTETRIAKNDSLPRKIAKRLGLTQMLRTVLLDEECSENQAFVHPPLNTVIYESFLYAKDRLCIGKGTVIEHSFFLEQFGSISIGDDCLVSGLRSKGIGLKEQPVNKPLVTCGLTIPSRLLVQEVPLSAFGDSVYMVLGMDDDIKSSPCKKIYGRSLEEFLNWSGVDLKEIWSESSEIHDLWNARIHPVCCGNECHNESSYMGLFSWLRSFCSQEQSEINADENSILTLAKWKARRRLSLAQIRELAHAPTEFDFRSWVCSLCEKNDMGKDVLLSMARAFQRQLDLLFRLRHILLTRQHECIDIPSLVFSAHDGKADVSAGIAALRTLDEVIGQSFRDEQFDICGRAWMLSDELLTILQDCVGFIVDPFEEQEMEERVMECLVRVSRHRKDVGFKNIFLDELELFAANTCRKLERQTSSASDVEDYTLLRNTLLRLFPALLVQEGFRDLSEKYAHAMTRLCVMGHSAPKSHHTFGTLTLDRWVLASAPARVDLAGGWSDTPPICFEFGSHCTGLAVSIDGKKPLSCRSRLIKNSERVLLKSEHRDGLGNLLSGEQIELYKLDQMEGYNDPSSKCALLKCALVVVGLVSVEEITDAKAQFNSMGSILSKRCGTTFPLGLEVVVTSMLPHGSGMGSSSIIAGCILASLGKCLGLDLSTESNAAGLDLIDRITVLEQELTSGGGFQDQVNGLFGGAKTVSCQPLKSPLVLTVDPIQLDSEFQKTLDDNLVLVFTGQTRLAKDILQSCLRRWASRNPVIMENVKFLVQNSHQARDALRSSSLLELGQVFNKYWEQKKIMAGKDSGVEPTLVARICKGLAASGAVYGASLCGAGGGGFLALIKSEKITLSQLEASILEITGTDAGVSVHTSAISKDGLAIATLPDTVVDVDFFDVAWMDG